MAMMISINFAAHPHSSIFWPARVGDPPPACQPDAFNTCQSGPSVDRLHFLDPCAPTQTRSFIKQGFNSSVHKVQHKIPQELIKEGIVENYIKLILEKYKCRFWIIEKCHALPHRFDIQPTACCSVQPHIRPTNLPHLLKARRHLPLAVRLQSSHY